MRGIASVLLLLGLLYAVAAAETAPDAAKILRDSGVTGGLVVHLGCGDGTLTAALRKNDSYLVQGLDADAGNVAAAKENIRACGAYGPVTVKHWPHAHLPYADGVVNLLVVSADRSAVSQQEIERVVHPDRRHGDPLQLITQQTQSRCIPFHLLLILLTDALPHLSFRLASSICGFCQWKYS